MNLRLVIVKFSVNCSIVGPGLCVVVDFATIRTKITQIK